MNNVLLRQPLGWGLLAVLLVFLLCFLLVASVKPPMASPDEPVHLARAATLLQGDVLLYALDIKVSGGKVNDSIHRIIDAPHDAKSAARILGRMKSDGWSQTASVMPLPATVYYFPAVYIPAAIGLAVGKAWNLSLYASYLVSNSVVFLSVIFILLLAWSFYKIPPQGVLILLLPMSVFQICSPTIDGITIALVALIMSLAMHLREQDGFSRRKIILLCCAIAFVAGSRANLLPLVMIPLWLYSLKRNAHYLYAFLITTALVAIWSVFAVKTVQDGGLQHAAVSQWAVLQYYLLHPVKVLKILYNTLNDKGLMYSYVVSFIGQLGWLDVPISSFAHHAFLLSLIILTLLGVNKKIFLEDRLSFFMIGFMFFSTIFLTFFCILVQWNTFPAGKIYGVQGRYFLAPALIASYAFIDGSKQRVAYSILIPLGLLSVFSVYQALSVAYFESSLSLANLFAWKAFSIQ